MTVRLDSPPTIYPDSDGKPMADNTVQFRWIQTLHGNIDLLFRDRPDVFVAGDHLIYPVQDRPAIRAAPDVYVAVGRPKGDRGSYKVWEEGGIFPQVVIEVLSPNNTRAEMDEKRDWYFRYGAEEYIEYDPDRNVVDVWVWNGGHPVPVPDSNRHVSPRLGLRFDTTGDELVVRLSDGRTFLTFVEQGTMAEQEKHRAEQEKHRAEQEKLRAEREKLRADKLAAKLRELGLDPDAL